MGKVMIVEDNPSICTGLKEIVLSIDLSIDVITTGYAAKALSMAKNDIIEMFILDIHLKDYSGITLAEEIREIEHYTMTPIIFITSIPTHQLNAFIEIHCYDYIIKPFQVDRVKKTISNVIKYGISNVPTQQLNLILKQKGYSISVPQKDIVYIESKNRKLIMVTTKEIFTISTYTLLTIEKELCDRFIRCHKGFIVNESFIYKVDKSQEMIYLTNDYGKIPFGENYREALKGEWL
ncbi:MAG: DNA-binding response regulator [Firmicutes bacterium HGW-Firmicutes-1]|jgi:two-component system LytT family response regulator|nr:MAG: DNA-binding response regulator [Firmicutes bacterium HGW-Firmicutes-1]